MSDHSENSVKLTDCSDFETVLSSVRELQSTLNLTEDELNIVSREDYESFDDVKFDLIPSFDNESEGLIITPSNEKCIQADEKLKDAFVLNEDGIIQLDIDLEIIDPLVFRFGQNDDYWIMDHPEDSLFRFTLLSGEKKINSFTIPRGTEKFCIGFPGNIIIDSKNNIYILDVIQQTVHKFSADGEYDSNFQDQILAASPLLGVRDFEIMESENIMLISDYIRGEIIKFDLTGTEKDAFVLNEGPAPQAFETVTGIAASSENDHFFIIDPSKNGILELDLNGNRIGGFFLDEITQAQLPFCAIMQIGPSSTIFLADFDSQCFHTYDFNGSLKGVLNINQDKFQSKISFDFFDIRKDGKLYLLDPVRKCLHCFQYSA
jgi:hypothetical protein